MSVTGIRATVIEDSLRQLAFFRQEQGIRKYLSEVQRVLEDVPIESVQHVVTILLSAYLEDRHIFIMGNGGSAATASHFANDLNKAASGDCEKRFRAIALTDNVPLLTAWGNDLSYEDIFLEQLKNLYGDGSVVIGISGSGNSENVLKALRFARNNGGIPIGFTGFAGGKIKSVVEECIVVPSCCMAQIEDVHLVLEHLICTVLREEVARL
jgi:D-sedoheptulose 7-phosphate isomerase